MSNKCTPTKQYDSNIFIRLYVFPPVDDILSYFDVRLNCYFRRFRRPTYSRYKRRGSQFDKLSPTRRRIFHGRGVFSANVLTRATLYNQTVGAGTVYEPRWRWYEIVFETLQEHDWGMY